MAQSHESKSGHRILVGYSTDWVGLPALDVVVAMTVVCLILTCVAITSKLRKFLETNPLQHLGKVSYSSYLWHGPVVGCLDAWSHMHGYGTRREAFTLLLSFPISLVIANFSYRLVELPFLANKPRKAAQPAISPV